MKSYDISNIINGLYEQLVYRNERFTSDQGIYFACKVDCQCLGYENDGNTYHPKWRNRETKVLHITILNHHQVFTCVTNENGIIHELPLPNKWINKSNHDSCWRNISSDELTDLMFHCHNEAYKNCPKEHRPSTRSQGVNFSLRTSLCGPVFKYVEVEKESDYELDSSGYHKKLISIKFINK